MNNKIVKVIFVRHGESTGNKNGILTGWTDVPLTFKGEK
jgi:broad specificity phosphatase PhoE